MPLVNMSIQQLVPLLRQDEFAREHFLGYIGMLKRNKNFTTHWKAQNPEEITKFKDYQTIFKEFRDNLASSVSNMISAVGTLYCILMYSRTSLQRPSWEQRKMAVVAGSGRYRKVGVSFYDTCSFRGYNIYVFKNAYIKPIRGKIKRYQENKIK